MRKSKSTMVSLVIFAIGVACNVSWAINDYGIKDMKNLDSIILAQASDGTTNDGGDSTTGAYGIEQSDCVYEISGKANGYISFGGMRVKCGANGIARFTYYNAQILCTKGGNYANCKQISCGDFYISLGTPIID